MSFNSVFTSFLYGLYQNYVFLMYYLEITAICCKFNHEKKLRCFWRNFFSLTWNLGCEKFPTFRKSAGVLQKCNTFVTEVFRSVTGVVKECYRSLTHLSQKFLRSVTGVVKECYRSVTHLPQEVFRSVTGGVKEC